MKGDRFQKKKKKKNLLDDDVSSKASKLTLMVYYQGMSELLKRYQFGGRVYYKNHEIIKALKRID
jgi:hypothetical protein